MHLSRRSFLALSAIVVVGCSGSDDVGDPAPASTPATTTDTTPDTSATTSATTAESTPSTDAVDIVLDSDPFTLGVASCDPDATSVVLWTRLVGEVPDDGIDVAWEVTGRDGSALASGIARTDPSIGGSIHAIARITEPGTFLFRAGGFESAIGTTSPMVATGSLRFATASCQHYETGFYAAHRDIAEWAPDLVLFLGDFIYEGDAEAVGDERVRSHEGDEPTDLAGYRARYATYLADDDLQASRAACPWLVIWDDHEVENDYAGLSPQNSDDEAGFAERRSMAYQAWWEHTPTRLAPPDPARPEDDYPIYRSLDIGDLIAISALDGRQYRSDQVCDATLDVGPPCPGWDDPSRTMLGSEQEAWLAQRFASTTSRWNCVAQQTVMTDLRFAETGGILNYDQWDGYVPARDRVLAGAPADLIVVTGDIHLAGVGLLGEPTGTSPIGVEFVTTAISSTANVPPELQPVLAGYANVVDAELAKRGYTRHTVTTDQWTAEFRTVDDVADPNSPVSTWKTFVVDHGSPAVAERT
jgi:alkaline phosphatase D